jgi:predicted N-formylglutamate amidohydrolase
MLRSHRGWDPGAAGVARLLAKRLGAPLFLGDVTRLVVDLNRSVHNPAVFGPLARGLSAEERAALLERHHGPHWARIVSAIQQGLEEEGRVLHIAVHSFAPVVRGKRRTLDLGLLYDPRRAIERDLAADWRARLLRRDASFRIRRNHPYRGRDDGLPTSLRKRFDPEAYCGIELEMGQALLRNDRRRRRLTECLMETLEALLVDAATD